MGSTKVIGLVVAPLATPFAVWAFLSVAFVLGFGASANQSYDLVFSAVIVISLVATPIAYVTTIVFGIPSVWWFDRKGWSEAWRYGVLGLTIGAFPFLLIDGFVISRRLARATRFQGDDSVLGGEIVWQRVLSGAPKGLLWLGLGAACALGCSLLYWVVAVRSERGRRTRRVRRGSGTGGSRAI